MTSWGVPLAARAQPTQPRPTPRQPQANGPRWPQRSSPRGGAQPDSFSGAKLNVSSGTTSTAWLAENPPAGGSIPRRAAESAGDMHHPDHQERGTPEGEPTISIQLSTASAIQEIPRMGPRRRPAGPSPPSLPAMRRRVGVGGVGQLEGHVPPQAVTRDTGETRQVGGACANRAPGSSCDHTVSPDFTPAPNPASPVL